jgi:hypothetical protein
MPFRYVGRQVAIFNNYCRQNTRSANFWRTARNTVLGYGGIKIAGMTASALTGNRDLEYLADLAAPATAGAYALSQTETFSDGVPRGIIIVGLTAALGADIGEKIASYYGSSEIAMSARDLFRQIHANVANRITDYHNPAATGAVIGGLAGMISQGISGYVNETNNR